MCRFIEYIKAGTCISGLHRTGAERNKLLTLLGAVVVSGLLLADGALAGEILSCPSTVTQTTPSSSTLPPAKASPSGRFFFAPFPFNETKRPAATAEVASLTPVDNGCITEVTTPFQSGAPYMILGPDHRLWYGAQGTAGAFIGAIDPTKLPYTPTEYGPLIGNALQLTVGPDGNIWFVEQGSYDCLQTPPSKVGRILTHEPYTITEFPVPGPISPLYGIATGPDGNLWFTRIGDPGGCSTPPAAKEIARMLPYPPYTITTYPLPSFGAAIDATIGKPYKLVAGHDNHLWFNISPYMGRLDPYNGKIEIFTIPGATGNFPDIGPGPASDPDSIWFMPTVNGGPAMARISTKAPFEVTVWPLTLLGGPNSVSPGPDGNMWFTEGRTGYAMGRFNPLTGEVTELPIVVNAYPRAATCGPDGNVWYSDLQNPLGLTNIPGRLAFVHDLPGLGTEQGKQFCESLMFNMFAGQ